MNQKQTNKWADKETNKQQRKKQVSNKQTNKKINIPTNKQQKILKQASEHARK